MTSCLHPDNGDLLLGAVQRAIHWIGPRVSRPGGPRCRSEGRRSLPCGPRCRSKDRRSGRNPCYSAPHRRTDNHAQRGTQSVRAPRHLAARRTGGRPAARRRQPRGRCPRDTRLRDSLRPLPRTRRHRGRGTEPDAREPAAIHRRRRAPRDRGQRHRRHRHAGPRLAEHQGNPERRRLRPVARRGAAARTCRATRRRARSSTT